ncbi:unnamed protein product [Mytilus edulis]|uniref:Uncharacterized protein n=1 Tax=Mytilus edulis TaxID=6550 RepID=A0A8S3QGF7_MYTED|nr:unnamed protein product [Mytilus edulis]
MAENMDFSISTENLYSDENLDLNDDFTIPCSQIPNSQKPKDEIEIAEEGVQTITELSKRRYPLLTMKTLLEFQKKHSIKSGIISVHFNGNVGPKTNNEVNADINKTLKPAIDNLQDSIIQVLNEHINKLNVMLSDAYTETIESIGVTTEKSGDARNMLNRKSREINDEFEKRLRNYSKSLKYETRKNTPSRRKPETKKNGSGQVLNELAKLLAKHK